jgi:hypothetical protein
VKPIVDEFESRFTTFHFFFERQFLLRVRADENLHTASIIPFVNRKLTELNATDLNVRLDRGYTEEPDYLDGWPLAQKMFETESRTAILMAEAEAGNVRAGPQFNEGKFIHLLLNQRGCTTDREALFHFETAIERLEMLFSENNMELVSRKHRAIYQEVWNSFGERIQEIVKTRIDEP